MENQVVKVLQNHLALLNSVIDNCAHPDAAIVEILGQSLIIETHDRHLRDFDEVSQCLMAEICIAGQVRVNNGKLYFKCVDDFGNEYWDNVFLHRSIESW